MFKEIIKFSGILRSNGMTASIRSTKSACEAIALIKNDQIDLKTVLSTIYLKNNEQRKKFDELYDSFFYGKAEIIKSKQSKDKDVTMKALKSEVCEDEKTMIESSTKNSNLTFNMYKSLNYPLNTMMDTFQEDQKIDYIKDSWGGMTRSKKDIHDSNFLQNDLSCLNSPEPELINLCQLLGRKLASKRARRVKKAKKETPDIRRSIRKNLKNGGTLMDLVKSKPKIKKTNHYFLSDVSISCDWISLWFFCIIYVAQNTFYHTRAFEFDNKTVEITTALNESNLIDAFLNVLNIREKNAMIHGKSNMYTAFEDFLEQSNLNNKSQVMILSDCRDWAGPKNGDHPLSEDLIQKISKKAKNVLILNPEPKAKWDVADSCISYYTDAGAKIHEVRNLEQLADLITTI